MTASKATATLARAPSIIQLGRRILVIVGSTVLVAMLAWLWLVWQGTSQAQIQRMGMAASLIAGQANSYFGSVGGRLQFLASELNRIDPLRHPNAALALLRQFKADNPELGGGTLILPSGQILVSTAYKPGEPLPNVLVNPEWREDFAHSLATPGLSINRPQIGYLLKKWIIPLRYAVRDRNGRVRYLLQTSILLERQQMLWRSLSLPEDAAVGLLRSDGYLISRWPNDDSGNVYTRKNLDGALYRETTKSLDGVYEGVVVDGSYRFGAYQRLDRHPIFAFLSLSRQNFLQLWWRQVQFPVYFVFVILAASVFGYLLVARRYAMQMRVIERQLRSPAHALVLPSSGVQEIDQLVTALADTQQQLRDAARNREKLLLNAVDAGTYVVREHDGVVMAADATLLQMLDLPERDVVGKTLDQLATEDSKTADSRATENLARRIVRVETNRTPRWLSLAEYRETGADGDVLRHGLAIDVSDREHLLNQINIQSLRLQALWQLATNRETSGDEKIRPMLCLAQDALQMDAVMMNELTGDTMVIRALADSLRLFEVGRAFAVDDTLCSEVVKGKHSIIIPDLRADPDLYRNSLAVGTGLRGYSSVPIWAGATFYGTLVFMRRNPLDEQFGADDRAFMELLAAWFGQILVEKQQREELESLAMTDGLTKLINRRAAEARFGEEFSRARREHRKFSIAICDLDRFKLINDHYGHDVGDQVLLQVARIMKSSLREGDWVARWGGEEFIIFLRHAEAAVAKHTMERLRLAIKGNPVSTAHGPLEVTISIGIGTFRGEGDLANIMSEADGCLFEAKRAGRDHVVMSDSSQRGTLWKAGMLQHALLDNRIIPAYQAIVDLRTNEIVADESLARLVEPDGRIVPAGEFIEAAEGINLIHIVDEVIARQSMQRCAIDMRNGKAKPDFAHFINLSPQFLARGELVQAMLSQAAQHCRECGMVDVPVKPVVLEITERQMIGNFEDLIGDLQPLLDFGFRLALDDFGSGYSSFLYLASLPISFLKIEGWMVRNMRDNAKVLGMVRSIIHLARDHGITTVAECVEDAATADQLRELGADWAQGYYFGRPECEIEVARFLRDVRTGTQ
jgi:diguanylate cyclase (GGDEF)-like protein